MLIHQIFEMLHVHISLIFLYNIFQKQFERIFKFSRKPSRWLAGRFSDSDSSKIRARWLADAFYKEGTNFSRNICSPFLIEKEKVLQRVKILS